MPVHAEWIESNGAGSLAMSTVCGRNDRRYHGLLVAALDPPVSRHVIVAKVDETVESAKISFPLSTNRYVNTIHPDGYRRIVKASRSPFPTVVFSDGGIEIERSIILLRKRRAVALRYRLLSGSRAVVTARPLLAMRQDHGLMRANGSFCHGTEVMDEGVSVRPIEGMPAVHFSISGPSDILPGHGWYYDFEYSIERDRGLDCVEDLWNPLGIRFELIEGRELWLVAGVDPVRAADVPRLAAAEAARRRDLCIFNDPAANALATAADSFVMERAGASTIFAGHPWFVDWGRDTMISLPGICIYTERIEETRSILQTFIHHAQDGMLPNRFSDHGGAVELNTVDATLWMFEVGRLLYERGGEWRKIAIDDLYPTLKLAFASHERGAHHGIRLDEAGFIRAGEPGVALTWMDARVDGVPVTPRHGRAVEIQALWCNALRTLSVLAGHRHDRKTATRAQEHLQRISDNFEEFFWMEKAGYYSDVVSDSGVPSESLRPGQLFVMLLAPELVSDARAVRALEAVRTSLVVPLGLRTLEPGVPAYRGIYEGGPASRDRAYHQGTAWPWLLGPFARAWAAFFDRQSALRLLQPLLHKAVDPFPGSLPEIVDGDAPWRLRGCPSQAWSVAETLHALIKIKNLKPVSRA